MTNSLRESENYLPDVFHSCRYRSRVGVEGDNDDAGTNVATKPFNDTAPAIEVPALSFSVNVGSYSSGPVLLR